MADKLTAKLDMRLTERERARVLVIAVAEQRSAGAMARILITEALDARESAAELGEDWGDRD